MKDSKNPYAWPLDNGLMINPSLMLMHVMMKLGKATTTTHLITSPSVEMMTTTHLLGLLGSTQEHAHHHPDIHNHITKVMMRSLVNI